MRTLVLLIAVAGAYILLRGWQDAPGMLLRSCLAVATLVAGLAFWGIGKRDTLPRMHCLRRATWLDYLSLGAAIIFTEACFVVLTSTLAAPAQEFTNTLHGGTIENSETGSSRDSNEEPVFNGHTSGNWLFDKSLNRNLPPNSNHKPSNKPEVFVELDSRDDTKRVLNSRIHLRAFVMSRFNGATWSAPRTATTELTTPIKFPRDDHKSVTTLPIKHTIYHAVNPTGQNVLTAFHGAISTDIVSLNKISDDIYFLPPVKEPTSGYAYSVTSRPVNFTDLISENLQASISDPAYHTIPNNLAARIRETASNFGNDPSLAKQLTDLRLHLQENYKYSLETTNSSGANPLENFLYQEKRGYCEHFATAAALICRALGVPSRIAYGWSGGRLYQEQNMIVFRAKDAHAWTEIKLKGYGWVVFDTTPADDEAVPETRNAPAGETPPDPEEATASTDENQMDIDETSFAALRTNFSLSRLAGALVVLGVCCLVFLIARYLGRPETDEQGRPVTNPTLGYLLQFKQACASLGEPMPAGRTLRQHISNLETAGITPTFASDLLAYHYGVLYGDLPRNSSQEKRFSRSIQGWQQEKKIQ